MKFTEVRLLCFSAEFCGICRGIEKSGVVEKFTQEHFPPRIAVQKLICGDKNGELSTEAYKRAFAISDSYGVEGFPTFIIEGKRKDGSGFEIARVDAASVSHFSLKEFNRVYAEGLEAIEELPDDVESQDEASKKIPWG